jgi:glycosyltransferase involved in cell wall biosynthesis
MVRIVYEPGEFDDPETGPDARPCDEVAPSTHGRPLGAIDVACALDADVTIVETREAQAALLAVAHDVVVERLPAVFVAPHDAPPGPAGREGLLFVGRFQDRPSLEAIVWFVDRIWPLIRLEAPDLALRIAGFGAEDECSALSDRPGIEVLGSISDLPQLYDRHRVLIAPFRSPGAGMRDEVGRSLAHGLPVVATSTGSSGLELKEGVHILVADQEEAFAGHVLQVLRDDALWLRLSGRGRAQVETTLSVDAFRTRLDAVLGG